MDESPLVHLIEVGKGLASPMKYQIAFTMLARCIRGATAAALIVGLSACSSGGSDDGSSGLAEGEACYMLDTSLECDAGANLCYAVVTSSPCSGGGLCIGQDASMVCAQSCSSDTDCATVSATAVCMQGCAAEIINGFCVEPAARDDLLSMTCSTWSPGSTGSTGVSG